MSKFKVSTSTILFRIDIDFDEADVDMVYKEAAAAGVSTPVPSILCDPSQIKIDALKLKSTPTANSVRFCLGWLEGFVDKKAMRYQSSKWYEKTELEEIGIEVESTYGLMMGTCHLICECDSSIFSKELVEKAQQIVNDVFSKYCVFYGPGEIREEDEEESEEEDD